MTLQLEIITKKRSQIDLRKATFYLYLFYTLLPAYTVIIRETIIVYWHFMGILLIVHFRLAWILLMCTYVLRGFYICGYVYISDLTAIHIPSLPSDGRLPLFLTIPLFECLLEILSCEFPQHTPVVKPWVVLLLLYLLHSTICISYVYHLALHMYLY